jgi:hypothetical protein
MILNKIKISSLIVSDIVSIVVGLFLLPYDLTLTEIKDLNKIVNTKYNSLNEGYN